MRGAPGRAERRAIARQIRGYERTWTPRNRCSASFITALPMIGEWRSERWRQSTSRRALGGSVPGSLGGYFGVGGSRPAIASVSSQSLVGEYGHMVFDVVHDGASLLSAIRVPRSRMSRKAGILVSG
jgi:hypothetical protein